MDNTQKEVMDFTRNIEVDLDNYLSEFDSFNIK